MAKLCTNPPISRGADVALSGEQWENTYWHDDNGRTTSHPVNDGSTGEHQQGMLFSPHVGSGSGKDPLVSESSRAEAIHNKYEIAPLHKTAVPEDHPVFKHINESDATIRDLQTPLPEGAAPGVRIRSIPMSGMDITRGFYDKEEGVTIAPDMLSGKIDSGVIAHELGHQNDPNIVDEHRWSSHGYADPVKEGVAEAAGDRETTYKDTPESKLDPSKNIDRAAEVSGLATSSGYTTENGLWSQTPRQRVKGGGHALFAASRIVQGMSGDNKAVPSRDALWDETKVSDTHDALGHGMRYTPKWMEGEERQGNEFVNNTAHKNDHLLGHLYTKHAAVRSGLEQLGLQEAGEDAGERYMKRHERWYSHNTKERGEQQSLPFPEDA